MDKSCVKNLFKPIDPSAISLFRILFGLTLLYHLWEQFFFIPDKFIKPEFFFTYPYFEFIQPWPPTGMYVHWLILVLAALGILLGAFYRFSIIAFWLFYTYFFLIDASYYKNHFYLITLISFLLIFINADAKYTLKQGVHKAQYLWNLGILRFQFCVVYFFAGIAKINGDWLRGEPMIGLLDNQSLVAFFVYGGLIFDLFVPFLLINKKTRTFAAAIAILFHIVNLFTFPNIKVFVFLMLSSLIIFFEPDWPKHVIKNDHGIKASPEAPFKNATMGFLFIYCLVQLLAPLRHFIYPGDIMWTAQGERFAWRMVLKRMRGGAVFQVMDTDKRVVFTVDPQKELSRRQYAQLVTNPDFILQYAHHLKEVAQKNGIKRPAVFVDARSALNGRPLRQMVAPHLDLTRFSLSDDYTWWVVPYDPSY